MQSEDVANVMRSRTRRANICDLREYSVGTPECLRAIDHGVTLRGWIVQTRIRQSEGFPTLLVRIITPEVAVFNFASNVPRGETNALLALTMFFSMDMASIFRDNTSDAEKDRCIDTLNRVTNAARGLPRSASGRFARTVIDCAAHDINPEQARTFRAALKATTLHLAARDKCPELYYEVATDVLAAFMKAGWTPLDVATLYRDTLDGGRGSINPMWIRSTATRTTGAETLLRWTSGVNLLKICELDMPLARQYQKAGWSFQDLATVTRLSAGGLRRRPARIAKGWHRVPANLAMCALRAGLKPSEAHTLFARGDLNEETLAMLTALRA